jgi:two-component system, chemotaxis family, sensor histidine kinase and response regulator WspE
MATPDDLSNLSMVELFRVEAENQTAALTGGLLELERAPAGPEQLESLMRAAHSLKGAGRIVNLTDVVHVAHAMEDCFVAAQKGRLTLRRDIIDQLLRGVDLLAALAKSSPTAEGGAIVPNPEVPVFLKQLKAVAEGAKAEAESAPKPPATVPTKPEPVQVQTPPTPSPEVTIEAGPKTDAPDRVLRLTAENLNRLLGLAGESLVESRWLRPFSRGRVAPGDRRRTSVRNRERTHDRTDRAGCRCPRIPERTVAGVGPL